MKQTVQTKQTILGESVSSAQSKLRTKLIFCILGGVACLAINIALFLCSSQNTYGWFLAVNIITDVLYAWFLLAYVSLVILPKRRMCELCVQPSEQVVGQITQISEHTNKVNMFDCYSVNIDCRTFFLPLDGRIKLTADTQVTCKVVSNIIVEVVQ